MQEIAEFFRVSRRTVTLWQDQGELKYRLKLTRRGRTQYQRVTDSLQFEAFLRAKLPQPHELDPTISATHRKLIHLREKARRNSALGRARRQRDPTLRLVPFENLAPSIDEVARGEESSTSSSSMGKNEGNNRETEEES